MQRQATNHLAVHLLCDRMPRLIILHVTMVAVMCAMTDPPSVVRYQDGRMCYVANKVIHCLAVAETLVATASNVALS